MPARGRAVLMRVWCVQWAEGVGYGAWGAAGSGRGRRGTPGCVFFLFGELRRIGRSGELALSPSYHTFPLWRGGTHATAHDAQRGARSRPTRPPPPPGIPSPPFRTQKKGVVREARRPRQPCFSPRGAATRDRRPRPIPPSQCMPSLVPRSPGVEDMTTMADGASELGWEACFGRGARAHAGRRSAGDKR